MVNHYETFDTVVAYVAAHTEFDGRSDYRQVVALVNSDGYDLDRDSVWKIVNAVKKLNSGSTKEVLKKLSF
jgi:hypothetical protein